MKLYRLKEITYTGTKLDNWYVKPGTIITLLNEENQNVGVYAIRKDKAIGKFWSMSTNQLETHYFYCKGSDIDKHFILEELTQKDIDDIIESTEF